jgi:hypothetical protein
MMKAKVAPDGDPLKQIREGYWVSDTKLNILHRNDRVQRMKASHQNAIELFCKSTLYDVVDENLYGSIGSSILS